MKTIFRLVLLAAGFLAGIFVGVKYPQQAANIDRIRAEEQAKLQAKIGPQIEAAVAKAKIDVLGRVLDSDAPAAPAGRGFVGSSGFAGGSGGAAPGEKRADLMQEMDQAKRQLEQAENKLGSAK